MINKSIFQIFPFLKICVTQKQTAFITFGLFIYQFICLLSAHLAYLHDNMTNLPAIWNINDKSDSLSVSSDGLKVEYTGKCKNL